MKFVIERSNEALFSHSGLALVGTLINKSGLAPLIDKIDPKRSAVDVYPSSDVAKSMIGLLGLAKTDFDDIIPFRKDQFFVQALDLRRTKAPSSPTIRQRLDAASAEWDDAAVQANVKLLKEQANIKPNSSCGYVLLSFDVSPMDNSGSHKEGVSWTYKKFNGFAPMFAHLGEAGHLLNLEFRRGSAHSQCPGTNKFYRKTIQLAKQVVPGEKILCLSDSGNDDIKNIKECRAEGADFIFKRNLRQESPEDWLDIAKDYGQAKQLHPGKMEYSGRLTVSVEKLDDPADIVFRVIERTIDRKGQLLIDPEIEVETYWVSLDFDPLKIIELYHLRGTFEQFHSEFKSDMDLERLPSGYFATNTRVMFLGMLAYNILRIIGQSAIGFDSYARNFKKGLARRRIKSVIQDLLYLACRLVFRSNRRRILLGADCPYFEAFKGLYYRWA